MQRTKVLGDDCVGNNGYHERIKGGSQDGILLAEDGQ